MADDWSVLDTANYNIVMHDESDPLGNLHYVARPKFQEAAPTPKPLYVCRNNSCVEHSTGESLEVCQAVCGPSPTPQPLRCK